MIDSSQTAGIAEEQHVHTLGHVDQYLKFGQEYDASDIHLSVSYPPCWRRYGTLQPIWPDADELTAKDTERLAMGFLSDKQKKRLKERGVLIVPGHNFFVGIEDGWPHQHECIRVSYARDAETVRRGVAIIAEEVTRAYQQA